jgi:hypothetical protein
MLKVGMTKARGLLAAMLAALVIATAAGAAATERATTVRVHFPRGATGTEIQGHLHGSEIVDYRVGVRAGQMMRVELASRSTAIHFNIYEPGKTPGQDAAFYIGDVSGNTVEFRTAHNGDYIVRVFLVRAAARRGESASYRIEVSVGAGNQPAHARGPASPARASTDARVAGTEFNATGMLPCARDRGQPMMQCRFGVKREGNGNGWITVFWPDAGNRVIFFEDNTPMRYDESQADGGARMTVGHEADLYYVRIGSQRFEIPSAVMTGG